MLSAALRKTSSRNFSFNVMMKMLIESLSKVKEQAEKPTDQLSDQSDKAEVLSTRYHYLGYKVRRFYHSLNGICISIWLSFSKIHEKIFFVRIFFFLGLINYIPFF